MKIWWTEVVDLEQNFTNKTIRIKRKKEKNFTTKK